MKQKLLHSVFFVVVTGVIAWASGLGGAASLGDILQVFGCTSDDCSALTAAAGDSLNMASGDSSIPAPQSATLPATCTEGFHYQDTNAGGTEYYVCTAANTWVKLAGTTGETTITLTAVAHAALGTATAGLVKFCSDCTRDTTCADSGTGALAVANGTIWSCD